MIKKNLLEIMELFRINPVGKMIIFAVILICLVFLFINMTRKQILSDKAAELSQELSVLALAERKKNFSKTDPLTAFQNKFVYSRITVKFPLLSAQLYMFFIILFSGTAFITALAISHEFLPAALSALCVAALMIAIIYFMADSNFKKTDAEILEFLNLLGNYSIVNGEITRVLQQVGRSMHDPIRSCIYEFTVEAQQGDTINALRNMRQKIEHPKFREIIRDMEVSLRYSTNYADMIAANRKLIRSYMDAKTERKAIANQGNIQMLLIICCLIIMFFALGPLLETDIWTILFEQTLGHICLLAVGTVLFIYVILSKKIIK